MGEKHSAITSCHLFRWKRVSRMLKFSKFSGPDEGSLEIDGWYWSPQIKLCRLIVLSFGYEYLVYQGLRSQRWTDLWYWVHGETRGLCNIKKTIKQTKWRRRPHVWSAFPTVNWFPWHHLWYTHRINHPHGNAISSKTRYPSYGWHLKLERCHENIRSGTANPIATSSKENAGKEWFWYRRHRSERARTCPVHMPWSVWSTRLLDDEMCKNADWSSPCPVFQYYINTIFQIH